MKALVVYESPNKFKSFSSIFEDMDVSFCYTQGRIFDLPNERIGVSDRLSLELEPIDANRLTFLDNKLSQHETVYCLTDNDPEGEWIASHIKEMCKKHNSSFVRVRLEELTKDSLHEALAVASSDLDDSLVSLAVARRAVDRVIGYHDNKDKELKRGRVLTPVVNHIHQHRIEKQATISIHLGETEVIVSGKESGIDNLLNSINDNPSIPLFDDNGYDSSVDLHNTMDYMMERSVFFNTEPEVAFDELQNMYTSGSVSYTRTENKKYEVLNGQHKGIHAVDHKIDNEDAEKSDGSGLSNIRFRTMLHLNGDKFDIKEHRPSESLHRWCQRDSLNINSIRTITRKRKSVHEIPRPLSIYFGEFSKKKKPECKVFRHSKKSLVLNLFQELNLGTPATFHTHVKKISGLINDEGESLTLNTKGMRVALQTDPLSLQLANLEISREVNELIFNNTLSIEDRCKKCLNVLRISDHSTSEFELGS